MSAVCSRLPVRLGVSLALAVMLTPVLATAASRSSKPPALEELGEVVVSGEKPVRKAEDLIPWLRRLLGQYTYQGYVDLQGRAKAKARLNVTGLGTCVGFGAAPGVQCEINVRWPQVRGEDSQPVMGSVSSLDPAMILYGLEPDDIAIRYLQVDSRGLAEGAVGTVTGDTATFRTACVDAPAGCERITRITAVQDSKIIDMQVDTEIDYQLVLRYRFQLYRFAEVQQPADDAEEP